MSSWFYIKCMIILHFSALLQPPCSPSHQQLFPAYQSVQVFNCWTLLTCRTPFRPLNSLNDQPHTLPYSQALHPYPFSSHPSVLLIVQVLGLMLISLGKLSCPTNQVKASYSVLLYFPYHSPHSSHTFGIIFFSCPSFLHNVLNGGRLCLLFVLYPQRLPHCLPYCELWKYLLRGWMK